MDELNVNDSILLLLMPLVPFLRLDSDIIDRQRSRAKNSEGGDVPQKYFVVTNNQLLRVKYLLVYSQRKNLSR